MALAQTTILDVRTTGSDSNSGGFATVNTNMATDLAATNANTSAPVVTSASYNFIARDVGHWLYVSSGTNWTPGWYQIASVNAGAATLTATIGTASLGNFTGASTVVGCATVASPTGGTWSVDYSQTDAAGVAFTDLVIDGVTNTDFTSEANPIGKSMVGNIVNQVSGTGFTVQRWQIVSVTGTTGRADKSLGTLGSTGGVGNLGGCLLSPGVAGSIWVAGMRAYVKGGTYTMSVTNNVAGGRMTITPAGTTTTPNVLQGWSTIRGDGNSTWLAIASKPSFRTGDASATLMITCADAQCHIKNIDFQRTGGHTSHVGIQTDGTIPIIQYCSGTDLKGIVTVGASAQVQYCYFTGRAPYECQSTCSYDTCVADAPTSTAGFNLGHNAELTNCIVIDGTVQSFLQTLSAARTKYRNCLTVSTGAIGQTGFDLGTNALGNQVLINCLAYGRTTGYAYGSAGSYNHRVIGCAYGNCTTGFDSDLNAECIENSKVLTADPFEDLANKNFAPNNAPGGGAMLRALGFPTAFPGINTTNYTDVGPAQHQDAGAASITSIFAPTGLAATGQNKTTQTTVSATTNFAISAGQLIVILVATDNVDTTDLESSRHSTCTVNGEGATKAIEFTNGQGSADAGATISVWYLVAGSNMAAASAVVGTLSEGKDAKAITLYAFDWNTAYSISVDGTATLANDAADPGSLTGTGTLNVPHLWIRGIALEESNTTVGVMTPTSGWTNIPGIGTTGGAAATNMSVRGEFKIATGTGSGASNPTAVAADCASVVVGLAASLPDGAGSGAAGCLINSGLISRH